MFDPFAFAEERGIRWRYRDLPDPLLGLYVAEPEIEPIILLSPALRDNRRLNRCVMAEEVGHHETSAGVSTVTQYLTYGDLLKVCRTESLARRWAVQRLIPDSELWSLIASRETVTWDEAAAMFDVIPSFMRLRMHLFLSQHYETFYVRKGNIAFRLLA